MKELTLEESLSMFMAKIAKRHDENTNLIKELRASTDFALRNQKASIKALEIQPRVNDETISTSVKAAKPSIRRIDASQYAVSNLQNKNLFSESKKMTLHSPSHLNDDYWDKLKEIDREKDLEAHYTNAKPLGKALPRKEKDPGSFTLPCFIKSMCFNKALADLGARVSVMPYSTYTTLGLGDLIPTKLIVELADRTVKRPKRIVENVLVGIDKFTFLVDFIILDIPEDFKTPLILGRPFLSTAHAIINVFKAKITLSVGNDKIFFKSNKPTSNIIKRVYALSLIESTKLGLETRLMGNELRKNKSQDPKFEDFIELNDLNEPIEHRRNQVKVFVPTIEEGEVIMKYLVKISKNARILELKQRNMKKTVFDIQYAVSIKEDTAYPCPRFTKDHEGIISNTSTSATYQRLVDTSFQSQIGRNLEAYVDDMVVKINEIRAERLARTANPLALVAQKQPIYHPQNHPTHYTQNSSTKPQQAATRNRGKAIINSPPPTYDQEPEMVGEDDALSKDKEIDKLMALISLSFKKIYKPTNNNLRTSSNTSSTNQDNTLRINRGTGYDNQRVVNIVGARENAGTHMIQEVTPDVADNSGPIFDAEPLQKVKNDDDNYNVFANDREHPEQPESVNVTYPNEHGNGNITTDSLDMSNNGGEADQNCRSIKSRNN
ncbi:zinc finger, CCHC-type containing protein [Tanacetum coccineum]|uniref:Zinc finger, CCHC-type containing protein n=1 Tax=Tanacetum coccineum TaxID=301880 RepID=A0ABQ5EK58_9ASTR